MPILSSNYLTLTIARSCVGLSIGQRRSNRKEDGTVVDNARKAQKQNGPKGMPCDCFVPRNDKKNCHCL